MCFKSKQFVVKKKHKIAVKTRIFQSCILGLEVTGRVAMPLAAPYSVGYEHRSLENPLGSLENLPARRALVLEMLEKKFGSVFARLGMCSKEVALELARLDFLCSKCSNCARFEI